ncbi:hypothetical protein IGI04_028560 [Brassica rapa subsp. trilocularis]|uniref:Knottin scorpion toxin-like domain-containing protein n=1 Tax=Brassica rapa subsp. trilocularis TaxID=1813537 RepID=A0ABQ7L2D9_BRACM|nr:hypothetical protein IGI04_028560 [Brassica rapa subsp. trilocularis]
MEMKRMILFMVMMLTIGNLMVESKVTNRSFQLCFRMCFNICIIGPPRDKFGCFGKCTRECTGKKIEIDCVFSQDLKKEIDVKNAKDYVDLFLDMCDKRV